MKLSEKRMKRKEEWFVAPAVVPFQHAADSVHHSPRIDDESIEWNVDGRKMNFCSDVEIIFNKSSESSYAHLKKVQVSLKKG